MFSPETNFFERKLKTYLYDREINGMQNYGIVIWFYRVESLLFRFFRFFRIFRISGGFFEMFPGKSSIADAEGQGFIHVPRYVSRVFFQHQNILQNEIQNFHPDFEIRKKHKQDHPVSRSIKAKQS